MDSGGLQDHWPSGCMVLFQMHESSCKFKKQVTAIGNWSSGELCGPWASCSYCIVKREIQYDII